MGSWSYKINIYPPYEYQNEDYVLHFEFENVLMNLTIQEYNSQNEIPQPSIPYDSIPYRSYPPAYNEEFSFVGFRDHNHPNCAPMSVISETLGVSTKWLYEKGMWCNQHPNELGQYTYESVDENVQPFG